MTPTHLRARSAGIVGTAAVLAVLMGSVVPAAAAPPGGSEPGPPPATSAPGPDPAPLVPQPVDPKAAEALAAQSGIPVAEATRRLAGQRSLAERGAGIERSLAGRSGGYFLDQAGELVVTTLDAAGDDVARRGGARSQRVDDTSARLDAILRSLDREAQRGGPGAVQSWFVDVPTNSVVVTVSDGATDARTQAMTRAAAASGTSVRVERKPAAEAPRAAEFLVGGYGIVPTSFGSCSMAFNARTTAGYNVVLTAGHCQRVSGMVSRNGYQIGPVRTTNYPGDDFGTFWNNTPSYWQPSPSVYRYDNNTYVRLAGRWDAPPVGTMMCKSGITTGYTCGSTTATNVRVVYDGTSVLYGLVQHNACVEPGDSGGATISYSAHAIGITSGAQLVDKRWCQGRYGRPNVSWYQPVGEALAVSGASLVL